MQVAGLNERYSEQLSWPDEQLFTWGAGVVGIPKEDPATSFVLHAPLELLARFRLLEIVPPAEREGARRRIAWLVDSYIDAGASVGPPDKIRPGSVDASVAALLAAIGTGDLRAVDAHAAWLGEQVSGAEAARLLGPAIAPSLAAAAHAPILLHLLSTSDIGIGGLLRGACRELARHPGWVLTVDPLARGDDPLLPALLGTPRLGMPGSDFIYPMVAQGAPCAAQLLASVRPDPDEAGPALSRVAAWSMLQDTPERAAYGWTHALTIPQAVMSIGLEPRLAVGVAATQLIGLRSAMGTVDLDPAPGPATATSWPELASAASRHHDAHVVKYTLACRDAAEGDPEMEALYLAAAQHLCRWWSTRPGDGFFEPGVLIRP